jgi:hypothetical protein
MDEKSQQSSPMLEASVSKDEPSYEAPSPTLHNESITLAARAGNAFLSGVRAFGRERKM